MKKILGVLALAAMIAAGLVIWTVSTPRLSEEFSGMGIRFRYPRGWKVADVFWRSRREGKRTLPAVVGVYYPNEHALMHIEETVEDASLEQLKKKMLEGTSGESSFSSIRFKDGKEAVLASYSYEDIGDPHPGGNLMVLGPTTARGLEGVLKLSNSRVLRIDCSLSSKWSRRIRQEALCKRIMRTLEVD